MARRILPILPLLAACAAAPPGDVTRGAGPPGPVAGRCHAEGVSPAVLETVTEQVVEAPPMVTPDGTVLRPARFRTLTTTRIVTPREITRFQTPCPLQRGEPDFVMQVQRALAARGLYAGPVHGAYDRATRAAVAAFQAERGLESGVLSIDSARAMGLVALGRGA